jgi:hypothetical protein
MVTLFCHIGLGDLILLSGAIVRLVERHGQLRIFCYEHHLGSVRSFFADYPGVVPVAVPRNCQGPYGVPDECILPDPFHQIRSGFYLSRQERRDLSFPEVFYSQLEFDYAVRWDACPIEKAASHVPQAKTDLKLFVHDCPARGYHIVSRGIGERDVYRPFEDGGSILQFVDILRRAYEIHCIDSSFYHLVESLAGITAALYYHRYARPYKPGWFDYPRRSAGAVLP